MTQKAEGNSFWRPAGSHPVCSMQQLWPHQPLDIPTQSAQTLTPVSQHLPAFICLFRLHFSLFQIIHAHFTSSLPSPISLHWHQPSKNPFTNYKVFPFFLLRNILCIQVSKTSSNLNVPLILSLCVPSCGGGEVRFHSYHAGVHVDSRTDTSVSHMFPQPGPTLTAVHSWSVCMCFWVRVGGYFFIEFYVCVCMPPLSGIRATPHLRCSILNTRLIKLPRGFAWPCCPHSSLYICHNNNGHQAVSYFIIVPLHYLQRILCKHWLSYAQQHHRVSMNSLMKLRLSGSIPLQTSQAWRAYFAQTWNPGHLGYGGCYYADKWSMEKIKLIY